MGDSRTTPHRFTLPLAPRVLLVLGLGSLCVSLAAVHLARMDTIQDAVRRQEAQIRSVATTLASRVAPLLRARDDLRLSMLGASAAQFGDSRVLILDAQGRVRLDTGLALGGKHLQLLTAGGGFSREIASGRSEVLTPALDLEGLVGEVRIRFPVVAAAEVGYSFAVFGGCLLACLSLLGVVGALCHHWTSNLREAVTVAHRLAHGDLSARCTRRAGGVVREMQDSLGDLGAVLGAGAQRVEQSFVELALQSVEVVERRGKIGHGERTRVYAGLLTRRLGLPPEDCRIIDVAARLHDLGEIFEPPSRVDDAEDPGAAISRMRRAPQRGADLIDGVSNLRRLADIVRSHRERYDGAGFPQGLQGERIPLGARIVGIADAYDQLTTVSVAGKAPMSWKRALAELEEERGETFDPWLVDLFIEEIRRAPAPRPDARPVMISTSGIAPFKEAQAKMDPTGDDDTLFWSEELEIELLGDGDSEVRSKPEDGGAQS